MNPPRAGQIRTGRDIFSMNAKPIPAPRLQLPRRQQMAIEMRSRDRMLPPDHEARTVWTYVCGLDMSVARVRNWGLYQVVVRGLEKVRAVALLSAWAHNFRQSQVLQDVTGSSGPRSLSAERRKITETRGVIRSPRIPRNGNNSPENHEVARMRNNFTGSELGNEEESSKV